MLVKEENHCRICRGELKVVLDLGNIHPSGFIKAHDAIREEDKAPLVLAECEDCKLVQLKHTVDLDQMYRQYWYTSSLNKSMVDSLHDIVTDILGRVILHDKDVVVDIGCNDGTMLELYPKNFNRVGFDPALNIERPSGFFFVNEYFSGTDYFNVWGLPKAKVVTAIAMFYDLPDPHQFVEDVSDILHEDGIFVVQFTDLMSMLKVCAFDNICHEHLEYYKLADVKFLLEAHGLEIIDVSYNDVNGGSIRITAAHEGKYPVREYVDMSYIREEAYLKYQGIEDFKKCIETTREDVRKFLDMTKEFNLSVLLLGASTKGNTFLQICNITSADIPYAAEVNKDKFAHYTAGSDIYILPEDVALSMRPSFFLVPVWHFKNNLLKNKKIRAYLEDGGFLIFPLPEFEVIGKEELE